MNTNRYDWQAKERMATPLHDLSDSDFEMRLERLAQDLEGKEEPCPEANTPATTSAVKALIA